MRKRRADPSARRSRAPAFLAAMATMATAATVAAAAALSLLSACGGDDACSGFISINASAERCMELAEEFGCESFEVDGPTCGLLACARCEDD